MIPKRQDMFFERLPECARIYAIPYELSRRGVQKYGREGKVHQWALGAVKNGARQRFHKIISIFIGRAINLAAIQDGRPIDVSDGFSSLDGLFSETGCGAVDSSIIFQMLADGVPGKRIEALLSRQSGFKALAGGCCKLRNVLQRRDPEAEFARGVFCYRILKYIGAFIASLGGLDAILFIGEGLPEIRALAFDLTGYLQFMGVKRKTEADARDISCLTVPSSKIKAYFLVYPDPEDSPSGGC